MRSAAIGLWGLAVVGLVFFLTSSTAGADAKTTALIAVALGGAIVAAVLAVAGRNRATDADRDEPKA
jgi:hypothetical protein